MKTILEKYKRLSKIIKYIDLKQKTNFIIYLEEINNSFYNTQGRGRTLVLQRQR